MGRTQQKEWSLRAAIKHPFRRKLLPEKAQNHSGSLLSTNSKPVVGVPMAHDVLSSPAYKTLTLVSAVPM
jgi:hypothetical protein